MLKFNVTIKGLSPLLQARHPSPKEEAEIAKRQNGSSKIKVKELTDEEKFEMHAYKDKDGNFYQPSEMIEAAMTKAAVNFKLEGKKTYKDLIKSGIIVEPVEIIHKNNKPNNEPKYDSKWAKNPTTRGAVWVVRPRFDNWQLDFTINLLQDERISPEVLKDILVYAGAYVGIGAWRPKFGRFEVTKFSKK